MITPKMLVLLLKNPFFFHPYLVKSKINLCTAKHPPKCTFKNKFLPEWRLSRGISVRGKKKKVA